MTRVCVRVWPSIRTQGDARASMDIEEAKHALAYQAGGATTGVAPG